MEREVRRLGRSEWGGGDAIGMVACAYHRAKKKGLGTIETCDGSGRSRVCAVGASLSIPMRLSAGSEHSEGGRPKWFGIGMEPPQSGRRPLPLFAPPPSVQRSWLCPGKRTMHRRPPPGGRRWNGPSGPPTATVVPGGVGDGRPERGQGASGAPAAWPRCRGGSRLWSGARAQVCPPGEAWWEPGPQSRGGRITARGSRGHGSAGA